jgi:carbon-monoxide dehydrogenase medium subunit
MHEFELIRPRDLSECLQALAEHGEHASLLAGGTDLYILMETGLKSPGYVIDLGRLGELRYFRKEGGRYLVGAGATHADIASGFATGDREGSEGAGANGGLRCLSVAAGSVGSLQIRNTGTVGGNIANASPSGDIYPPLLALGATLSIVSSTGERELPLSEFATGPGLTVLGPDEMITRVGFAAPPDGAHTDFVKVGLRNALAISVASAAIVACGDGNVITDIRIACGAVAPRAIRMHEVEEVVAGSRPSRELVEEARRTAGALCCPISDIRGTAEYRRHVTGVIVSRLVEDALRRLTGYAGRA